MLKCGYLIGLFLIVSSVQNYFPHTENINVVILLEFFILIMLMANVTSDRIKLRLPNYQVMGVLLFFGIYYILSAMGAEIPLVTRIGKTLFVVLLFFLLTIIMVGNFNIGKHVFRALILAGFFLAAGTIVEFVFLLSKMNTSHDLYRAASAVMSNPNMLSINLVMIIPSAIYIMFYDNRYLWRLIAKASLPLFLVAIILGRSRMGFIALLICFLMIGYFFRSKKVILVLLAIIICFLAIIPIYNTGNLFIGRMRTIASDHNWGERRPLFETGFDMIRESPLIGKGYGSFRGEFYLRTGKSWASHNSYIQIASEVGLIMLLLFLSIFGKTIYDIRLLKRRLDDNDHMKKFLTSIEISIYVFLICSMSSHIQFHLLAYIYIGLAIASRTLIAKEVLK